MGWSGGDCSRGQLCSTDHRVDLVEGVVRAGRDLCSPGLLNYFKHSEKLFVKNHCSPSESEERLGTNRHLSLTHGETRGNGGCAMETGHYTLVPYLNAVPKDGENPHVRAQGQTDVQELLGRTGDTENRCSGHHHTIRYVYPRLLHPQEVMSNSQRHNHGFIKCSETVEI
ncbi:hypothetical protein AV530_015294 [Patagioenas fasciata monilis]|uniref:Uncharacterized protein n=1 Tax=Patagioenas fasciata monilis TaxID=372326 RepID=A0A1V4K1L6_PATFA|nr:hypothetical protein AV530_015294 [Patagioenas fasciata monilis]